MYTKQSPIFLLSHSILKVLECQKISFENPHSLTKYSSKCFLHYWTLLILLFFFLLLALCRHAKNQDNQLASLSYLLHTHSFLLAAIRSITNTPPLDFPPPSKSIMSQLIISTTCVPQLAYISPHFHLISYVQTHLHANYFLSCFLPFTKHKRNHPFLLWSCCDRER